MNRRTVSRTDKPIIILFPYMWFPQAPTVMGLYEEIRKKRAVKIITLFTPERGSILDNPDIIYLNRVARKNYSFLGRKTAYWLYQVSKLWYYLSFRTSPNFKRLNVERIDLFLQMRADLRQETPCEVIAVDPLAAFFCQLIRYKYHYLSLELQKDRLEYMKVLNARSIKSITTQTPKRLELLTIKAKEKIRDIFFIQNAPNFQFPLNRTLAGNKLVYAGALWEGFGFTRCMEFIKNYPGFTLLLKGSIACDINKYKEQYKKEISEGRIIIDTEYTKSAEFNEQLSDCSIGFAFYDEEHPMIRESLPHYQTAPSGKMFSYFSLGIPVIGSSGLCEINDFAAGIALSDYSPASILKAIQTIRADYTKYSDNALKAAEHFNFSGHAEKYVDYLDKNCQS
jgi:hypothetical protein